MPIRKLGMAICIVAGISALIAPASPEEGVQQGQGQAIITILPKGDRNAPLKILQQDLRVKVNGKDASVTGWMPLRGPDSNLELVILIDSSARTGLGLQFGDIAGFIRSLPANVKVAIGYMNAGRAVFSGPLSTDHSQVAGELRVPGAAAGSNSSPYFCLSDLAKHWPSKDHLAQHEVVLITDGVDNYYGRYDPDDPYVEAAIADSVRAGLVVFSIYWSDQGHRRNSNYESFDGQSLLAKLTQATGGGNYYQGSREPVSLSSFFDDIARRLQNQYLLRFRFPLKGKPAVQGMDFKVGNPAAEVHAAQRVLIEYSSAE